MAEGSGIDVQNIGHLGLIAAVFKELKLVEKIDAMIPKTSNNRHISHGEAVMAMVMQSMGYSGRRFYLSPDFFSKHACKRLFGRCIEPVHINARVLWRTLDAIHEYGPSYFLSNLCLGAPAHSHHCCLIGISYELGLSISSRFLFFSSRWFPRCLL